MPEQVLPPSFGLALELGQLNEEVIFHEFERSGIPIIKPPPGKQDFDGYLQDGRSIEVKLDLRSQATDRALFEEPTMKRRADIHIHTLTYAMVFTREQVEFMYRRGKLVKIGDYFYPGRAIPKFELKGQGVYLDQFIKSLG